MENKTENKQEKATSVVTQIKREVMKGGNKQNGT